MRWPFRREPDRVSAAWLQDLDRQSQRIDFHGTGSRWSWPLNKRQLENGWRNRVLLRQEAKRRSA